MFFLKELPSGSSIFSTYASMAGSLMLIRSMAHDIVPRPVQDYIISSLRSLFNSRSSTLTLIIDNSIGPKNLIYDAAEVYLSTKLSPDVTKLRVNKRPKDKHISMYISSGETVTENYEGVELIWRFLTEEADKNGGREEINDYYELSFDKKHKDLVLESYLPFVLSKAKAIEDEKRILKMYTLNSLRWECVNLEHPSTFNTMAMDTELKRAVIEDLDRFIKRRDYYKRVGKAWKRGYLLYGPPGTGKSSLVAAMANHLKFDVYDLQLAGIMRDSDLRRLLLTTNNRSILVIEDIDCAVDLPNRLQSGNGDKQVDVQGQLTLSGLLNFIDGLWSSCGDERIIIFTTNHKEKLDPALLRPGRMDMHIHMGFCTFQGFKTLASNYLGLPCSGGAHRLYGEIESVIDESEVTPAQVAEELIKSDDADVALGGLVRLLKEKRLAEDDEPGIQEKKKRRKCDKSLGKIFLPGSGPRRKSSRRRK